ncbi:MAG TPA: ABC transporter ATP-binding protein [Thermomicrobiales bacterium]|nr:ABC transporter ATP-binding protein [Thermomicrobiales bacterium]
MTHRLTASTPDQHVPALAAPIIEIRGLVKRYKGFTAVDGIDLEVRAGEIFGILGPNGAGKTTTLEMIEGLRVPDEGSIRVAGIDAVTRNDDVRKIIGVQLQTTALFPYLNAHELVELFARFYEVEDASSRATELLKLVNLNEKRDARVDELSGGQQQRLSIALALVNTPKITFLDEPTTGLDPHARRSLWQTILDVRAAGTTVVLTTHYMEEAEVLCDRIAIMDSGQVIACDTPEGLIRDLPQDAVVSATIAGHGSMSISAADIEAIPGVTGATIAPDGTPPTITAQTRDVQATLVGLLQLAEQRRITLGELTSTRANLEDVFLSLTGRTYTQADDLPHGEETASAGKKRRRRGRS